MRSLRPCTRFVRLAAGSLAAIALSLAAGCAEGTSLATGVGTLPSLCGAYTDVISEFPLEIAADEDNEGRNPGNGFVRLALVEPLERCVEAAQRIRSFLSS